MTLYISDLDGTLLNGQAELSHVSRNLLKEMIADGLCFTVASARSVYSISQMLKGLSLNLPVIEFNGAFISDLGTGRHDIVNAVDPVIAGELYHLMCKSGCVPFLSTFNGNEDCLYHPEPTNDGAHWYFQDRTARADPRLRKADNLVACLKEQVVCFIGIGREGELTDLAGLIHAEYGAQLELNVSENQYSPGWYWLTVQDYRATKDQAICVLRDAFGLGERELIVFGDQINDLKMFSIADMAVAVENAVPALKGQATHVIGRHDHDSVAKFIYEHRRNSACVVR